MIEIISGKPASFFLDAVKLAIANESWKCMNTLMDLKSIKWSDLDDNYYKFYKLKNPVPMEVLSLVGSLKRKDIHEKGVLSHIASFHDKRYNDIREPAYKRRRKARKKALLDVVEARVGDYGADVVGSGPSSVIRDFVGY